MVFYVESDLRLAEEIRRSGYNAIGSHFEIRRIYLGTNAIATPKRRSEIAGARAHERIEHRVPRETEHSDQAFSELEWIASLGLLDAYHDPANDPPRDEVVASTAAKTAVMMTEEEKWMQAILTEN